MTDTFPSPSASADDADDWCTVAEAARRLGVTPTAIRGRIARRTLRTRPNGNHQGHLVLVPRPPAAAQHGAGKGEGHGVETPDENGSATVPDALDHVMDVLVAELRGRLTELQARATAAEAERSAIAQQAAVERVQAADERARLQGVLTAALAGRDADLDRHRREVEELQRELRDLRSRPWWQRIWSAA